MLRLVLSEGVMEGTKDRAVLLEPVDKALMPVHAAWIEVSRPERVSHALEE